MGAGRALEEEEMGPGPEQDLETVWLRDEGPRESTVGWRWIPEAQWGGDGSPTDHGTACPMFSLALSEMHGMLAQTADFAAWVQVLDLSFPLCGPEQVM